MISKELTTELQKIIKSEYGIDLSFQEAFQIGSDLVSVFDVLARTDFKNKTNNN